jgi:uncharacterized membrane protein
LNEGVALKAFVILIIGMIIVFYILIVVMFTIKDNFLISLELFIVNLFISVVLVVMLILLIVPNLFWPQQSYIGYVFGILIFGIFLISVVAPTIVAIYAFIVDILNRNKVKKSKKESEATEGKKELPQDKYNFKYFLTNEEAREEFKKFLVREFSVENLVNK